jgi:hypothetical protein
VRFEGAATPVQLVIRPDWRQTLTSVAGIVSVLLVAAGLFYTNEANRKQQEANQAQQALAERGQVTERLAARLIRSDRKARTSLASDWAVCMRWRA